MSKIIKLTSENIKRLSAVTIAPDGNVVVIGGKNGAGKSSVLDSIEYALGGATTDTMPVRRGEEKGRVVVDLGEIVVKRTFTATGGTALVVTNADGVPVSSPQSILDNLTGKLTFDPLEFSRQKPAQQAETLRSLVGLDFTGIDRMRTKLFDQRTEVNREVKRLEHVLFTTPKHEGVPETEISTLGILEEQTKASAFNSANEGQRRNLNLARVALEDKHDEKIEKDRDIATTRQEIERMQALLAKQVSESSAMQAAYVQAEKALVEAEKVVKLLVDVDLSSFAVKLKEAETVNAKVRQNASRAKTVEQFKAKKEEADKLTAKMEAIDSDRRKKINAAKWPIPGLSFDTAGGVTLDGIPFNQASESEKLRVSVAIGLALNPKLRVLLIRDGSLLDTDSLAIVADMASKADAQVWIERVGAGAETSVVIEDGHIADKEGK